jgi:hypothetical protein
LRFEVQSTHVVSPVFFYEVSPVDWEKNCFQPGCKFISL